MKRLITREKLRERKAAYIVASLFAAVIMGIIALGAFGTGLCLAHGDIELEDVADAAIDGDGNTYVLNSSGSEVLRINTDGYVNLVIRAQGSGDKTFERGLDVCVDDEGNIYVHNRVASESAVSWIGRENVVVFDKHGRYKYTSLNINYDVPALRPSIVSFQNLDGDIFAFCTDEQGILMNNVSNGDVSMFTCPEAERLINSAVYSGSAKCVYATTRDGRVLRLTSEHADVIYRTDKDDTTSGAFVDIDVDEQANLYVCDVRSGSVGILRGNSLCSFFAPQNPVYNIDYNNGFVFNETYAIVRKSGDDYYSVSSTSLSGFALTRRAIFYISLALAIIFLLYPIHCAVVAILTSDSNKVKILAGLSTAIAVVTIIFCMLVAKEYSAILSNDVLERAILNAKLVNNLVDADDFEALDSVTDFGSESYNKIKSVVDAVILDDGTVPGDMYLIMYSLEDDGTVTERYTLEEAEGCNYPYRWTDGSDEAYVYETGETLTADDASDAEGSFICVLTPLKDEKTKVVGLIEVGVDKNIFQKSVWQRMIYFAASIIAIAVVFVLLILELIEFIDAKKTVSRKSLADGTSTPPLKIYRATVFAVTFITNITTPFLSIYSLSLSDKYSSFFGVSSEILAAVPISAEVLFGAIFSMVGGSIIEKLGSRKSSILGSVLFTVGLVIRFVYPDLMVLTLGNAMQGAGWGIVLLIINSRIAAQEDESVSEQGFTDYNIALQNGLNSGIVFGGFLLAFADYTSMLVIAAVLSVVVFICSYYFIFDGKKPAVQDETEGTEEPNKKGMSYFRFIFSPKVLVYFLFIVMPVIAASYYLNFLYPILADRLGVSESLIGYSYLINGMVVICFGNIIVNFMSKYFDKKVLLLIASLIYLVTFAVVGILDSIPALLISLILLAISDSFGYVAQSTFYTDLEETGQFGYEKAMGVYSLFENLSQSAGSFIFGYILTVGVKVGMTAYGIVIGVLGALFVLVVVFCDRSKKRKGSKAL